MSKNLFQIKSSLHLVTDQHYKLLCIRKPSDHHLDNHFIASWQEHYLVKKISICNMRKIILTKTNKLYDDLSLNKNMKDLANTTSN